MRIFECFLALCSSVGLGMVLGCSAQHRPERTRTELLELREQVTVRSHTAVVDSFNRLALALREEQQQFERGELDEPPVLDVLILSGGGDWGAFGAGVLKGWGRVSGDHELARPRFDVVTGVSAGALIAPFAFIGDDDAIEKVNALFRNPERDWIEDRGLLFFLPNNASFSEIPGLERELRANVDMAMVERIAQADAMGRVLSVNTTNLDDASARAFYLTIEAENAVVSRDLSRFHNILLASAGIPGAFPHRVIDDEMYVDGGVTGNILYSGSINDEERFPTIWAKHYPGVALPKMRYWVIFNNQVRVQPMNVAPRWPGIITRSVALSIRSSTITAIRHLFTIAELMRLKYQADVEVRYIAIPGDWNSTGEVAFDPKVMNELADIGERLGADHASWLSTSP